MSISKRLVRLRARTTSTTSTRTWKCSRQGPICPTLSKSINFSIPEFSLIESLAVYPCLPQPSCQLEQTMRARMTSLLDLLLIPLLSNPPHKIPPHKIPSHGSNSSLKQPRPHQMMWCLFPRTVSMISLPSHIYFTLKQISRNLHCESGFIDIRALSWINICCSGTRNSSSPCSNFISQDSCSACEGKQWWVGWRGRCRWKLMSFLYLFNASFLFVFSTLPRALLLSAHLLCVWMFVRWLHWDYNHVN